MSAVSIDLFQSVLQEQLRESFDTRAARAAEEAIDVDSEGESCQKPISSQLPDADTEEAKATSKCSGRLAKGAGKGRKVADDVREAANKMSAARQLLPTPAVERGGGEMSHPLENRRAIAVGKKTLKKQQKSAASAGPDDGGSKEDSVAVEGTTGKKRKSVAQKEADNAYSKAYHTTYKQTKDKDLARAAGGKAAEAARRGTPASPALPNAVAVAAAASKPAGADADKKEKKEKTKTVRSQAQLDRAAAIKGAMSELKAQGVPATVGAASRLLKMRAEAAH